MSETANPNSEDSQQGADAGNQAETAADFDALVARLDKVHADLARRRWWLNFSNRAFTIVGLLLLALLTGYFTYGYVQIKELADSRNLYALLEQNVQMMAIPGRSQRMPTTLSQARGYIEREIAQGAPKLAAEISEQLLSRGPDMRELLEDFAIDQAKHLLDEGAAMTEARFRDIINNNRDLIEQCLQDLQKDEQVAEERLDELVAAMEQELRADLRNQVEEVLDALQLLNERLVTLSKGKQLTREGELERQLVMVFRRIQMEEVNPSLAGQPIVVQPLHDAESEAVISGETDSDDVEPATYETSSEGNQDEPAEEKGDEPQERKDDKPDEAKSNEPTNKQDD